MKTRLSAMFLVLVSTIFASSGQILVKMGANNMVDGIFLPATFIPLVFGYGLYLVGAALLIVSLKWGELSVLYPIYALNFIWVSILSPIFFTTDTMNLVKWIGVFFVVCGVSVVGLGSRGDQRG
jgi:multidrug transporter EmrE-like cation transporter